MKYSEKPSGPNGKSDSAPDTPPLPAQNQLSTVSGWGDKPRSGATCQGKSTPDRADIEMALNCEERAQRLSHRMPGIEDSIRLARIFLNTSEAIEQILVDSLRLLKMGRTLTEPSSRKALAETFRGIKQQIDDIVADAEFNGQNLAAGDSIKVILDENNLRSFQIDSSALSSKGLELSEHDNDFESNADITSEIMQVRSAISMVGTRRAIVEMGLSLLENRAGFSRNKIHSLQRATHVLVGQGNAYGAICKIAARRIRRGQQTKPSRSPCKNLPASNGVKMQSPLPAEEHKRDGPDNGPAAAQPTAVRTNIRLLEPAQDADRLDGLVKDMARLLKDKSYLENWFKYESGDTRIFTQTFAGLYGPRLIQKFAKKYRGNNEFRETVEQYVTEFEARIEQEIKGKSDRKTAIEEYLKTDQGTIYIILIRARNRT